MRNSLLITTSLCVLILSGNFLVAEPSSEDLVYFLGEGTALVALQDINIPPHVSIYDLAKVYYKDSEVGGGGSHSSKGWERRCFLEFAPSKRDRVFAKGNKIILNGKNSIIVSPKDGTRKPNQNFLLQTLGIESPRTFVELKCISYDYSYIPEYYRQTPIRLTIGFLSDELEKREEFLIEYQQSRGIE